MHLGKQAFSCKLLPQITRFSKHRTSADPLCGGEFSCVLFCPLQNQNLQPPFFWALTGPFKKFLGALVDLGWNVEKGPTPPTHKPLETWRRSHISGARVRDYCVTRLPAASQLAIPVQWPPRPPEWCSHCRSRWSEACCSFEQFGTPSAAASCSDRQQGQLYTASDS